MAVVGKEVQKIGEFIEDKRLNIPEFQRPYKWTVRNVVQLLDDIDRFKAMRPVPYRIGTVIIWDESGQHHIVDGQQRTVSFLLIFKALEAEKYTSISKEPLKQQVAKIAQRLFSPRFKSDISKDNIWRNYREIMRRMATLDDDFIDFFLHHCEVTKLVINKVSEAFQFFDSQNARGKDLEPHDLLKAFHLRELNSPQPYLEETEVEKLVETWEDLATPKLSALFADFMFRVRGWCRGKSSRYFTKKEISLFKGFNIRENLQYPYLQPIKMIDTYLSKPSGTAQSFPFQLDAPIINGKHFFEMVAHYHSLHSSLDRKFTAAPGLARRILQVLNNYKGMDRTGDKYVRMLFNCALLYYYDKFGEKDISKAIEKIFVWAYRLRLTYQNLQIATIDNYVVKGQDDALNLFQKIRDAVQTAEILSIELPIIEPADEYRSEQSEAIRVLFSEMRYLAHE